MTIRKTIGIQGKQLKFDALKTFALQILISSNVRIHLTVILARVCSARYQQYTQPDLWSLLIELYFTKIENMMIWRSFALCDVVELLMWFV